MKPFDASDWQRINDFWHEMADAYEELENDPKGFFWVWMDEQKASLEQWAIASGLRNIRGYEYRNDK